MYVPSGCQYKQFGHSLRCKFPLRVVSPQFGGNGGRRGGDGSPE